jgi:hypothetical protein
MALIVVIIALFNTSCFTFRTARPVTLEEIYKMPPFDATVETIDISHPFIFMTEVDLWLRKAGGGDRLYLQFAPANKFIVDFARTLHEGQRYSFPQVFEDYNNSQSTNAVNTAKH